MANCELNKDDPNYNEHDHLSLPYQHVYFMDVMSFFDVMSTTIENAMADAMEPVFSWMVENLKGDWRVCTFTHTIEATKDVRIELWFSFDLAEDAMLSRMTWTELRLRKYGHP